VLLPQVVSLIDVGIASQPVLCSLFISLLGNTRFPAAALQIEGSALHFMYSLKAGTHRPSAPHGTAVPCMPVQIRFQDTRPADIVVLRAFYAPPIAQALVGEALLPGMASAFYLYTTPPRQVTALCVK